MPAVTTGLTFKEMVMGVGIISSIVGASIGYGTHTQKLEDTKGVILEIKEDVKKTEQVNLEQTIAIKEQAIILERTAKLVEKLEKKINEQ